MLSLLFWTLVLSCNDDPDLCLPGTRSLLPDSLSSYTSIEEILADLPQDFRMSFSMVRKGSGLQPGTDEFPRIIMSHCRDKCDKPFPVLAFHGNPEGRNYNTLEIAEFNPQKPSLNFFVIRDTESGLEFSNANPKDCTNCHFKRPQLIWSPYPLWPTLYRPAIHHPPSEEERALLEKFWSTRDENPRYQFLGDKSDVYLSDDPSINPNYEIQEVPDQPGRLQIVGIAKALFAIERGTITRNLKTLRYYRYLKYTFAGIFSDCSLDDLIPTELSDIFPDDFEKYRIFDRVARERRRPEHLTPFNFAPIVSAQLMYFLEHLGVDSNSWFAEGKLPSERRQNLMLSTNNSAWAVAREALLDDDTRPMYETRADFGGWPSAEVYNCEKIGPVSKAALNELFGR